MISFYKGTVGRRAYRVSKVWSLGFHTFLNGEDLIFRLCYLRTKRKTHYCQVSININKVRKIFGIHSPSKEWANIYYEKEEK